MREPLTIAVAQPPCVPYDVAANAATHAAAVRSAGARVVVFPELSLTGYELDAPAITAADPRLAPIAVACAEEGALALVGAPVQDEPGRSHIAMVAIDGTGARVAYRKMWLGTAEAQRFTRAASQPYSTLTAGGSALPSARTPGFPSTPPAPPRWASTPTWPAR